MLQSAAPEVTVHKVDGSPDERRWRRVPVRNLAVRNPVLGTVVDLTENGLGLVCSQPLRVFNRYTFTVVTRTASKIRKQGEVRWSRLTAAGVDGKGEPELAYRVGIAFLET